MLEKDKGSPKIHRLRIIQILEFDLNLVYTAIWSNKLIQHAEQAGAIVDKAYDARSGRRAISAVLNKVISYNLYRKLRKSGATFDNTAVGCFDRIIREIGRVACRCLGLPKEAT